MKKTKLHFTKKIFGLFSLILSPYLYSAPKTFRGMYAFCEAGIFQDAGEWEIETAPITLESGSMGYTMAPTNFLANPVAKRIRGEYQVTHALQEINRKNHIFSLLGFMMDGGIGYNIFLNSSLLLGIEARVGCFGGSPSSSSLCIPSTQRAIFNNDSGYNSKEYYYYTTLYGEEISTDQRGGLLQQVDNAGNPTKVFVINEFFLKRETIPSFFLTPMICFAVLPRDKTLLGLKCGAVFCRWNISWSFSGEYGSSAYFVDNFAGHPPTVRPQEVTWSWEDKKTQGPVMENSYLASEKTEFWNIGVAISPYVEMKISPFFSFFLQVNAFMWEKIFDFDVSLDTKNQGAVEFSDSFQPRYTVTGNIGFKIYFNE